MVGNASIEESSAHVSKIGRSMSKTYHASDQESGVVKIRLGAMSWTRLPRIEKLACTTQG